MSKQLNNNKLAPIDCRGVYMGGQNKGWANEG